MVSRQKQVVLPKTARDIISKFDDPELKRELAESFESVLKPRDKKPS